MKYVPEGRQGKKNEREINTTFLFEGCSADEEKKTRQNTIDSKCRYKEMKKRRSVQRRESSISECSFKE